MLAKKAGVDPRRVFQAIRSGLAGSTVLDAKMPMIIERDFAPGFKIDLHIKDLTNALEEGMLTGSPMILSSLIMQYLSMLKNMDEGGSDHSAIAKIYEYLAKDEICS